MSGWMYIKKGIINDSEEGPFADATLLQLALDGAVNPKTLVVHPTHTNGQWVHLDQIPSALKNYEQGVRERQEEAHRKRRESDELKAAKRAEKETRQAEKEAAKHAKALTVLRAQRPELVDDRQIASSAQHMASPFVPHAVPQPSLIVVQTGQNEQRLGADGWFVRAFSTTAGIMMCIIGIPLALLLLLCGGCLMLGVVARSSTSTSSSVVPETQSQRWTKTNTPKWVGKLPDKVRTALSSMMRDESPLYAGFLCDGKDVKFYVNRHEWEKLSRDQARNNLMFIALLPHTDHSLVQFVDDQTGERLAVFEAKQSMESIKVVHP